MCRGGYVEDRKFATSAPKSMQHRIFLGLEWVAGFLRFGFALLYIFLWGVRTKFDPVVNHFKLYTLFGNTLHRIFLNASPVTPEIWLYRAIVQLRVCTYFVISFHKEMEDRSNWNQACAFLVPWWSRNGAIDSMLAVFMSIHIFPPWFRFAMFCAIVAAIETVYVNVTWRTPEIFPFQKHTPDLGKKGK